jgi:hypothetical protein
MFSSVFTMNARSAETGMPLTLLLDGLVEEFDKVWCQKLASGDGREYNVCKSAKISWSEIVYDL